MHSSRMRTVCFPGGCLLLGGCLLGGVVCSGGCLLPGGCLLWGVSASGGCLLRGVSAPGESALDGCLPLGAGVSALGECPSMH